MKKNIAKANRACDEAMHSLYQTTYYIGKEVISFHKFSILCSLLIKIKANIMEFFIMIIKIMVRFYFASH